VKSKIMSVAFRTPDVPRAPDTRSRFVRALESAFVANRRRMAWLQGAMFVVFLVVVGLPAMLPDPKPGATALTDPRLALNYLLWGLWFPLVFLTVIVVGRLWCGVLCPMGAASELANRFGLKRPIPAWVRWEGTPAISFIVTTLLGQTLGVRDHPETAAGLFGVMMGLAILTGLLYGRDKRAWCRHLCPIGRVLGLYSRLGAVQFTPRARLPGHDEYTERGVCPTMIDTARKTESRHCIACFRCVNPKASGGVKLELHRPGTEVEDIRDHRANKAEAWFLFLDTGVALGGFLWLVLPWYQDMRQTVGEWAIERDWSWITGIGPSWLMVVHPERGETFLWLDFLAIVGFMLGCMLVLTAVLGAITAVAAEAARRAGADGGFGQRFTELGYQYSPVALMSLVIGLGAELLNPLRHTMLGETGVHAIRGGLFLAGIVWSVWLGWRILARQGVAPETRWLPLLPGLLGSVLVGIGWWPAIFGL
jgi:hypothetical protein